MPDMTEHDHVHDRLMTYLERRLQTVEERREIQDRTIKRLLDEVDQLRLQVHRLQQDMPRP